MLEVPVSRRREAPMLPPPVPEANRGAPGGYQKGRTRVRPSSLLAEWTGLGPATPGVTGRAGYYFCFLINVLLTTHRISFVQSCRCLSVHLAHRLDYALPLANVPDFVHQTKTPTCG